MNHVPAKTRPRTKPPEERRDELMEAAQALFLEHGVGSTTIEQITSRAGVAKGTFYLHYSSKEEIHGALGERFTSQFLQTLTAAVARRGDRDWHGKLAAWSKTAVTGFIEKQELVNMLFHTHPSPPDSAPNPIVEHLKALLKAGLKDQAWAVDDPDLAALFVFGGLHAIVDEVLLGARRIGRGKLVEAVQNFSFRAVGVSAASSAGQEPAAD
ncbi:TetR/AcrR family transcriptional regulator [Bosea sp. (in: a-proteobacteria)]